MRYLIATLLSFFCWISVCIATEITNPLIVQFTQSNTIYRIDRRIDLEGNRIEIPANCTIFLSRKGKIYNGELVGNNTTLKCSKNCMGAILTGSWQVEKIYDYWFDSQYLSDDNIMANINCLQSDSVYQRIYIRNKDCYHCNITNGVVLALSSNTRLFLKTTIQLEPNDLPLYYIISIKNKNNVRVSGGNIVGDVLNHRQPSTGSAGEWGMGINISNSSNVKIENVNIRHCWGDGVYVAGGVDNNIGDYSNACKNILLRNVVCDDNRRQGMSVEHVDGLFVENCSFINTGKTKFTAPGLGVDIEPNFTKIQKQSCKNLYFKHCIFQGNAGAQLGEDNSYQIGNDYNIENVSFDNCRFDGLVGICLPDVSFKSCELGDIVFCISESPLCADFYKCRITSNRTQLTKVSRRGHTDTMRITMRKCQIKLLDAGDWISQKRWQLIDNLSLDKCKIIVPMNNRNKELVSDEIQRLLQTSLLQYE